MATTIGKSVVISLREYERLCSIERALRDLMTAYRLSDGTHNEIRDNARGEAIRSAWRPK